MTATAPTVQNLIANEFVAGSTGETEPILNPATGEVIAHAPLSSVEDVNRAVDAADAAFDEWSHHAAGERALALLKLADAIEEHADELSEIESDNAGKPIAAMRADEIPFMADNLRFFAGAARALQGPTAGEYLSGYTSIIRREPIGVIGQISPWNYPLMMAVWKIGPALAAGNTVVLKPAETTPLIDSEARRDRRRVPADGRAQRDHRPRQPDRPGARHAPEGRDGEPHRQRRYRQVDRPGGRRQPQAGAPRARRQGAGGRVRRRRHGDRDGDDRRHRLLQRRPGLHRRDPRARRQRGLRRRRERPRRAGQVARDRRHLAPRRRRSARSTPSASASGSRASSSAGPATPRSSPAASRPSVPASTSSRRSSPVCSRTTR